MMFTIVVPVYNAVSLVRDALDSVLAQSCIDWECVCVDDGSTDGSTDILDEYARRDRRIKVIHQQNAGVSVARNRALDVAAGEWVVFLDGDDGLAPGLFEHITQAFDGVDMVGYGVCRGADLSYGTIDSNVSVAYCENTSIPNSSMSFAWNGMWQWAYRRSFVGSRRFVNGLAMGEDRLFCFGLVGRCSKVAMLQNYIGYCYRDNPNSVTQVKLKPKIFIDNFRWMRLLSDEMEGDRRLVRIYWPHLFIYIMKGLESVVRLDYGVRWSCLMTAMREIKDIMEKAFVTRSERLSLRVAYGFSFFAALLSSDFLVNYWWRFCAHYRYKNLGSPHESHLPI